MDKNKAFQNIFLIIVFFGFLHSTTGWAQSYENQAPTLSPSAKRLKRDFTTVIFSSLAGGILGLSTLSFYGEPQEHTVNITTGIILGFASGLGYVIYARTASDQKPPPSYQSIDSLNDSIMRTRIQPSPTYFAFQWDFE